MNHKTLKAFQGTAVGIRCIVFAYNVGQARETVRRAAVDAGYGVSFRDILCRRAFDFDNRTLIQGKQIRPRVAYDPTLLSAPTTQQETK